MLIVVSFSISACSLQPIKDRIPAPNPDTAPPLGVAIDKKPNQPLPVVLLESDLVEGSEIHVEKKFDIWERVRSGFSVDAIDNDLRISHYASWYRATPNYLHLVTGRAAPYLYFILQEIERRRLPTELALLPIIESAYIPFAYSRSHAAGIWQFMPDTARLYGLKQNWWYDGRRDIYASTLAALDYLEALNHLFKGDWLNTLAAYNAGPNRVLAEIEKNRRLGEPTDFWQLDLPTETQNYVPKLLAIKALVQDPTKFGIKLWPVPDEPYLQTVDIKTQIDLGLAAKLADMNVEPFHLLNPGFSQWATDPDGPFKLLLPIDRAKDFKLRLADLPSHARVTWLRHQIQSGETLSHIAQRYGISIAVLQQTNRLHNSRIWAGDHLLIPQAMAAPSPSVLAGMQSSASQLAEYSQGEPHTHVFRRGDSLWSIARSYGLPVGELASWNGSASEDIIRPGAQLRIWKNLNVDVHQTEPSSTLRAISYSVQSGDSLYAIARRFKVSITDLRRWNNLQDNALLHPGQAMTLYIDATQSGES
jgi:membrane-bound lytic murein transglycosylase D